MKSRSDRVSIRGPAARPVEAWILCACLAATLGCSTAPRLDGRPATEFTTSQVFEAAEAAARENDPGRSADLAEFILRNDFEFAERERVRYLAAEGRFRTGAYEDALIHYRRLIEDDPLSQKTNDVPPRLWEMGKLLIRERSTRIADFSARHDVGIEALNLLVARFPRHDLADDAWRELALAFREDGLHQAAADCLERMIRDFPEGEWTDFALFQVVAEYRALSRGHAYDVEPLLVAHAALRRYLTIFPDGNFVIEARKEQVQLENDITQREIAIADFYRFRNSLEGERLHLMNAARRFRSAESAALAKGRLLALGVSEEEIAKDSTDLLEPRSDRPRWAAATEKDVMESKRDSDP